MVSMASFRLVSDDEANRKTSLSVSFLSLNDAPEPGTITLAS
jgi:hypothetical protein